MLLEDFDENKESTFDPFEIERVVPNFPKIGITCFARNIIDNYIERNPHEIIAYLHSANGMIPVYKINYKGVDFALYMSRVGAPACVVEYEEALVMGLEKLIMFGTCGVLDSRIEDLAIIIPTSAMRDEGTSYHYMAASDEISINEKYKEEFIELLKKHNYSYVEGKTWTIDTPYRETRNKVLKRKEQGCISVEMESSAMSAVSKFRDKDFFTFFYAADNLDASKWDKRSLDNEDKISEKDKILLLALELGLKVYQKEKERGKTK